MKDKQMSYLISDSLFIDIVEVSFLCHESVEAVLVLIVRTGLGSGKFGLAFKKLAANPEKIAISLKCRP